MTSLRELQVPSQMQRPFTVIQLVFVKLGLQLDPFDNYDIEFHQACNTKTSMIGDQKGFSLSNYCDLGNEYDYSN